MRFFTRPKRLPAPLLVDLPRITSALEASQAQRVYNRRELERLRLRGWQLRLLLQHITSKEGG